ncbi:MAG TPA: helix-turn-helix domain-containing protein [Polyangiales bacterium]|nr:helix-turn-helix domain-containing protein [Polyangiales bacterium]
MSPSDKKARNPETEPDSDWLSIKEAADYLHISEPTLFRWMKDGLVSFYKVGRATRFKQASLDAVIEKRTGSMEAEASRARCASCGHGVIVDGRLQGTGRLYFRPLRTRFWTFQEAMVPTIAHVCTSCGYVQLHVETEKLHKLLPNDE